ncbi:MAG: glycosyltransferase family 2 protein [Mariprofundaceae bacterium]|nr:glycosyltransferase family 2 protein [Mariprofundaceae bacterium]
MSELEVSIITVCYNAEEFIQQCMESVLLQDFEKFEYIVIDGGSTDGTINIIKKYQESLAYWHSKPDRGLSHAFNQGLEQAKGEWVIFLNADDYFANNSVLREMSEHLRVNMDQDVVFGQLQRVARDHHFAAVEPPYGRLFVWHEFLKRNTIPHPTSFINRSFFQRVGGFDERYTIAMDYEFFLRGGSNLKARFIPGVVTCMRDGGVSRASRFDAMDEFFRAVKQHKASSNVLVFLYISYFKLRLVLRELLVKMHVLSE